MSQIEGKPLVMVSVLSVHFCVCNLQQTSHSRLESVSFRQLYHDYQTTY